jgi:hypothetical protein
MTHAPALRPSADAVFRELEGEAVILDLGSGRYFGLNRVGTRVWTLLDAGLPVDAIVAAISDEYDAEPQRIARDVRTLLDELVARGLIVPAEAPPRGSA